MMTEKNPPDRFQDLKLEDHPKPDEIIRWVLDFISFELEDVALTYPQRLRIQADLYRYLLWESHITDEDEAAEFYDSVYIQRALKEVFNEYIIPIITKQTNRSPILRLGSFGESFLFGKENETDAIVCVRILTAPVGEADHAVAVFLSAFLSLEKIPLDRFRQCDECRRFFFPTGKGVRKNRKFCSRTCNLKSTSRRQREIMRKKYAKAKNEKGEK